MTAATSSELPDISRRVLHLQVLTIVWMTVEAAVSLGTAWSSHSPALLAFGGDSLIELLSAAVVFWRFRFEFNEARRKLTKVCDGCAPLAKCPILESLDGVNA